VVTQVNRCIVDLFELGREVLAGDATSEAEAVKHYVGAEEEGTTIATAGQLRSHGDHIYDRRRHDFFATCGLAL
jgi:hypothetical protein